MEADLHTLWIAHPHVPYITHQEDPPARDSYSFPGVAALFHPYLLKSS